MDPVNVLQLNLFDSFLALLELFQIEIAMLIWEVLPLDASTHNFSVDFVLLHQSLQHFLPHAEVTLIIFCLRDII